MTYKEKAEEYADSWFQNEEDEEENWIDLKDDEDYKGEEDYLWEDEYWDLRVY